MSIPRTGAALTGAAALFFSLALPAVVTAAADATVASDPVFIALTVEGEGQTVSGRIRQFGPKGELTLVTVEGPERVIPLDMLVKLTRKDVAASNREPMFVVFPDGDRLYHMGIDSSNEKTIELSSDKIGQLAVPLESLLGLVVRVPANPDALGLPFGSDTLDALIHRVRVEPRSTEVVWLNNGDRLTGGFLALNERVVEIQPGKDRLALELEGVVAIGFDPSLVVYPKPEGGFIELTLKDGSRLGVSEPRVEEGHILAKARFGSPVRVPIGELTLIHARTPSVVYLTEREPAAERYVPYVGPPRPYRRNATVDGHPMLLSGKEYERGIGTQSRSLLAYRLEEGDRRFQALLGVDDRAGPLGSVIFRVLVDGKEKFVSKKPVSAHDAPEAIDVDVTGARALILITEFGERGGIRDLADWVEARVIR